MNGTTYVAPPPVMAQAVAFLEFVQTDLEATERRLNEEITSDVRTVQELSGHVLSAGGKRLRPTMVALAARAVNAQPDGARLTTVAAAMELVHMATLVHDDVVDMTSTRRGKPTANAVFGNGVAVLTGDFLLARAMRLLAYDGDVDIIRTVAEVTNEMSEGEVMEILATGNADITAEHYYDILRKKTAVFVDGCCRVGAMVAGGEPSEVAALAEYGYHLGMAFQIQDDLLDYTGDPQATGKPLGSDLRDGRATLPLLLALREADEGERSSLLGAFGEPTVGRAEIGAVVAVLERHDAFARTRAVARGHVAQADAALARIRPSRARECFVALTDYVVKRDR